MVDENSYGEQGHIDVEISFMLNEMIASFCENNFFKNKLQYHGVIELEALK